MIQLNHLIFWDWFEFKSLLKYRLIFFQSFSEVPADARNDHALETTSSSTKRDFPTGKAPTRLLLDS